MKLIRCGIQNVVIVLLLESLLFGTVSELFTSPRHQIAGRAFDAKSHFTEITGRVLALDTEPVRNAQVELVLQNGDRRVAQTNLFGRFRFFDIPTGGNFRISVFHRRHQFEPQDLIALGMTEIFFAASPVRTELVLDDTFGVDGKVVTDFGGNDRALTVFQQVDGKVIVVGASNTSPAIARYLPDGRLDPSYGHDGRVVSTNFRLSTDTNIKPALLQPDGKVVVGGRSPGLDFALERRNTDGTLDTEFGNAGIVVVDFGGNSFDEVTALAIQPDGKIVAVGRTLFGTLKAGIGVTRFHSNGSLDFTFGDAGKVIVDTPNVDMARSVAFQRDNKITLCGTVQSTKQMVVRLQIDGDLDTAFGEEGIAISSIRNLQGYEIAVQRNGRILGVGEGLVRYESSGETDLSFEVGMVGLELETVAVRADGILLVAGRSFRFPSKGGDFGVAMIHPISGQLISRVDTDVLSNRFEDPKDILVQADGKVVVAGLIAGNSVDDFAIVRYKSQ